MDPAFRKLIQKNVEITGKQWKEDFSVPVTFYSYGADEYELGDLVIPAGEDQLLEKQQRQVTGS